MRRVSRPGDAMPGSAGLPMERLQDAARSDLMARGFGRSPRQLARMSSDDEDAQCAGTMISAGLALEEISAGVERSDG